MLKASLAILAVAALPIGYVTPGAVYPASSAQSLADRVQPPAPTPPHVSPDLPVHHLMRTLDDHARVGMILYTGSFGPAERAGAASMRGVDFKAITLPTLAPAK